jgi:hypothetical protein
MNFIGADVHSVSFTMAYLNTKGKLAQVRQRRTSERDLIQLVGTMPGPKTLVVEESHLAQWVKHTLEPYVDRLIICDPKRNRWIAADDFADDKSSAIKLAELARGGYLKEIQHGNDESAALRGLFLHYFDCNNQVIRFKNKLKAKFRQVAIREEGEGMYDPKLRDKWLKRLEGYPQLRFQVEHMFNTLEHLEMIKDETRVRMVKIAQKNPAYQRLLTIPGIGPVLATGYIAILDHPGRFSRRNKLWRYGCLGNCYHKSDGFVYKDRPSPTGNRVLKWVVKQHYQGAMKCKESNRFQRKHQDALDRNLDVKIVRRHVRRGLLSTVRAVWMKEEAYRDHS